MNIKMNWESWQRMSYVLKLGITSFNWKTYEQSSVRLWMWLKLGTSRYKKLVVKLICSVVDVHVTVYRVKFLTMKPIRCTNFSNLFLGWSSSCFGQSLCPSCSILILLASCQQTCMTYTIAVCTVKNSWWWKEELSKTCRVSFQE